MPRDPLYDFRQWLEEQYGGDMEDFIPERAPGATATSSFDVASGYAQNRAQTEGGVPSVQYVDMPSTALPRYAVPGHSGPDNIGYALPTNIFRPYDPNMSDPAQGMSRVYRGTWLPNEAPGDPPNIAPPNAAAGPAQARSDIRYNPRTLMPQALERAQETAWNYFPNANVVAGSPFNITGQEAEGQRTEFSMVSPRTGEIMLSREQVNTARDVAGTILNRSVGALTGTTAGRDDPDKMVANYKREVQSGINDWFKGKMDAMKQAFEDDPQAMAQAKQTAQNMRNMLYRATNAAVKTMADQIGGGNFRDFAGAQRIESVEELRNIMAGDPAIAREVSGMGGVGAFVAGGGGFLGGGGGQGYVFGDQWGGGGGGGGGGRRGMWGGGLGAAMYGMYIGQRIWGYTAGGVLERGAAYGGMVGQMGPSAPFGAGGFAARAELSQMMGGRGAYPYAAAFQGLGMMANQAMPGALAATGMIAGFGGIAHLAGGLAAGIGGGEGALAAIGGGVQAGIGRLAGPVGAYMAGVNLFNLAGGGQRFLGRDADLLDPFRAIAAGGVQGSQLFQQDPAEWARQNAGLATFIMSGEPGLTSQQRRIQTVAERNTGLWNMEPTSIAEAYIGFERGGMFPSNRDVPETGYWKTITTGGGSGYRSGRGLPGEGSTRNEWVDTTMQGDEFYMTEYQNRAQDMGMSMSELQQTEFQIASQYGAPGTQAFRTAMSRMSRIRDRQAFGAVARDAGRFAQVAGTVQPYQDIDRTRMMLRQEQMDPAQFMRYGQYQAQFAQLGMGAEQGDLISAQMANMNISTAGGFMGVASAMQPYFDYSQPADADLMRIAAQNFAGLSPDEQGLMGRMMGGDLNAFNFAGLTGQFGVGAEFVSRDIAGAPIYQTDMQAFMDWGVAQAQLGINPEANRLFGGAAAMTPQAGGSRARQRQLQQQPSLLSQLNATMGQFGAQFTQQDVTDATEGYRGYTGFQAITARYQDRMHGLQQAGAGLALQGIEARAQHLWGGGRYTGTPGAGSMWNLQDIQRGYQWQAQLAGFAASRQQLDLRNTFAQQREAITGERMDISFDYRRWSRDFQRSGMDISRQYALEDRQYEDQMRGQQWGWQMEDIDEAIRLSSGRQRRTLVRQRGRMVTQKNMEEDRIETQRERQEEMWARQDERFEKQVEYEEDLMKLDTTSFELNRTQRQQIYVMDVENLERRLKEAEKMHDINERIIDKQRQFQADELERQKQQVGIQAAMAAATHEYNMKAQAVEFTFKRTEDAFKNIAANTRSLLAMTAFAALVDKTNNLYLHKPAAIGSMIDAINRLNVAKLAVLVDVLRIIQ
jgi:hypothetical protein